MLVLCVSACFVSVCMVLNLMLVCALVLWVCTLRVYAPLSGVVRDRELAGLAQKNHTTRGRT